jgi:hypothetical protein
VKDMFVQFMVELTGAEGPEDLEKLKRIAGGIMDGESVNVAVMRELEEMFPWMINLICQVSSVNADLATFILPFLAEKACCQPCTLWEKFCRLFEYRVYRRKNL